MKRCAWVPLSPAMERAGAVASRVHDSSIVSLGTDGFMGTIPVSDVRPVNMMRHGLGSGW